MNTKELRIGNYINVYRKPADLSQSTLQIESIYSNDGIYFVRLADGFNVNIENGITPVLLTEELLLKCGFEEVGIYDNVYHKENFRIITGKEKDCLFQVYEDEHCIGIEVSCVHQLQNLYFALTGKELEVRL